MENVFIEAKARQNLKAVTKERDSIVQQSPHSSNHFNQAVEYIRTADKKTVHITDTMRLQFYALFKQATDGPCSGAAPSVFRVVARAKWNAWKAQGKMECAAAKREYGK